MKVLFGIDVSEDEERQYLDGGEFVTASTPIDEIEAHNRTAEKLGILAKESDMPLILKIIMVVSFIITLITFLMILLATFRLGLSEAFKEYTYLFVICPLTAAWFFGYLMLQKRRYQRVSEDPETAAVLEAVEKSNELLYSGLGIPEDALTVDVLSFCYVVKKDRPVMLPRDMTYYSNQIVRAFLTDTDLCLADISNVYSIPLSAIRDIRTEKDKVLTFPAWNKDEWYNEGRYKAFGITEDRHAQFCVKGCCIVEFTNDGEDWEIWFPCYEEENIRDLLKGYSQG